MSNETKARPQKGDRSRIRDGKPDGPRPIIASVPRTHFGNALIQFSLMQVHSSQVSSQASPVAIAFSRNELSARASAFGRNETYGFVIIRLRRYLARGRPQATPPRPFYGNGDSVAC